MAKYHKKYYTEQNYFYQLSPPSIEKSSESEEFNPTSPKRSKRVSLPFAEMVSFIYNTPDMSLCAIRVMHASKTAVEEQHVKKTIKKIKTMTIDNKPILAKLSSGDIATNELIYHKFCYKDFVNKYNQKMLVESNQEVSLKHQVNK